MNALCCFLKENSADLPRSGKDEATSMAPQAAKQFGKVMFSEVPPEIRRETISSKACVLKFLKWCL
jgi:hypothetical protein